MSPITESSNDLAFDADVMSPVERQAANQATLIKLLFVVVMMLAFCASMVPIYQKICEVLGITATRAVAENTQVDTSRLVQVDFDASLNKNFAWKFEAVEKHISINPGAIVTVNYRVTNTMPYPTTGRASPSFAPVEAGLYFSKIECFCFSNQTLQANETRDMPVTFFVAAKLPQGIEAIALSYTFHDVTREMTK